jgi:hypothetical protein
VCDVTCLQSGAYFSGIVTTVGIGAVGVDEVVVVVGEACDMSVYSKLCLSSSSPSYQVTKERLHYVNMLPRRYSRQQKIIPQCLIWSIGVCQN